LPVVQPPISTAQERTGRYCKLSPTLVACKWHCPEG